MSSRRARWKASTAAANHHLYGLIVLKCVLVLDLQRDQDETRERSFGCQCRGGVAVDCEGLSTRASPQAASCDETQIDSAQR